MVRYASHDHEHHLVSYLDPEWSLFKLLMDRSSLLNKNIARAGVRKTGNMMGFQ